MKKKEMLDAIKILFMTFVWLFPYKLLDKFFWYRQLLIFMSSILILLCFMQKNRYKIGNYMILREVCFFGISTIISSFFENNLRDIVVQGFFTLGITSMFAFFKLQCEKNINTVIQNSFAIIFIYFLLDIKNYDYLEARDFSYRAIYFTGGKCDVGYNMILFLLLLFIILRECSWGKWNKRLVLYLAVGFSVYYSYKINAMTMLLGIMSIAIALFGLSIIKKLPTAKFMFAIFLSAGISILVMNFFLSTNLIRYFITVVLKRTISLTGRMNIYESIYQVISRSILFGNGTSSTYALETIGYSNLQNGLFQIIYLHGFFGAFMFSKLMYVYFKKICNVQYKWVIAFVLGYIVCSISEIVYDYMVYYYFMALSYAYVDAQSERETKIAKNNLL